MPSSTTRRQFVARATGVSLAALLPQGVFSDSSVAQSVVVRPDSEIGTVRPEFHSHFAEHLGSCVYGGIWVGKNSPIPNVNGYRKAAVDYLKELGDPRAAVAGRLLCRRLPLARRHRAGGEAAQARQRQLGTIPSRTTASALHEFIGFCRLIGAEPYFAANVGTASPQELRDWIEYCNFPTGSTLADERAANGSPEPFRVHYWGVGNEAVGLRRQHYRPDRCRRRLPPLATLCAPFGGNDAYSWSAAGRAATTPPGPADSWTRCRARASR